MPTTSDDQPTFAFVIHPVDPKKDVSRKFPVLGRFLPVPLINFFSTFFPPVYISEISGIRSEATGEELKGWFVACPYTPARMLSLPERTVYRKLIQTGRMAEKLGAKLVGLGAFTSVVGDAGLTVASQLDVPVTTGDSYTVGLAVQAIALAAEKMEIPLETATVAVVGAGGSIGSICAEMLADQVFRLVLVGRTVPKLQQTKNRCKAAGPANVKLSTDIADIDQAQLVITVTNAVEELIQPRHLRPGAVVCDVARPRDVSAKVAAERDDVLVIDGGMVDLPGTVNFNFDFGFPPGKAYACMAETMILALEHRYEPFSLGRQFSVAQVREIDALANKHGFKLSGFRTFGVAVTDAHIEAIKEKAEKQLLAGWEPPPHTATGLRPLTIDAV